MARKRDKRTKTTAVQGDEYLEELRESFHACDTNKDGQIQYDEFVALLDNLGAQMSERDCRIGFAEVDTDNDGLIDYGEFATWWTD